MNNDLIHRFQSACLIGIESLPLSMITGDRLHVRFIFLKTDDSRNSGVILQDRSGLKPPALLCESADGSSLPEPDFHQQCTTGLQIARRLLEEPPMDTHAIRTSGQCQSRLKAPDLRLKRGEISIGNIGRIGHHHINLVPPGGSVNRGQKVPLKTINARIASVLNHIALRDGQGLCRYIDSDHARVGQCQRHGHSQTTGPSSHIHDGGGWMIGTTTNCLCDQ